MTAGGWRIPREWAGEPCFILGGGASLKGFDASILCGRGRVIGIKESGLTLAPWADVLFWADPRWIDTNYQRIHLHQGRYKLSRARLHERFGTPPAGHAKRIEQTLVAAGVKHIHRDPTVHHSTDPTRIGAAKDSGGSAIEIACLFGADPIVLLGFDMRATGHWHDRTIFEPLASHYTDFLPAIERMAAAIRQSGQRVLNATPGSALTCFPAVDLEDILHMDFTPHVKTMFQTRGKRSTYTPDGGSAVACRAIRQGGGEPVRMGHVRVIVERTCFHVRRAEITAPAAGDQITFRGDAYTVDAVQPVERDPDQQMWSLETSWGAVIGCRSSTGSGSTQSPPLGASYTIASSATAGAASVSISSSFVTGRLVSGDSFTIAGDATVYTITAPVTASSNAFSPVSISPVLAADAAEDAAVTFDFARDYSIRAAVAGYQAQEIGAGVHAGDRRVVVLESALDDAGMSDVPKAGDRLTFEGGTFVVQTATAVYSDGVPVAWDLQVRG